MRSHPLVVKLGNGEAPGMRDLEDVKMYNLDVGFAKVQHEFGADLYKAADWRCAVHAILISFHAEQDPLCMMLLEQMSLQHYYVLQKLLPAFQTRSAHVTLRAHVCRPYTAQKCSPGTCQCHSAIVVCSAFLFSEIQLEQ